MKKFLRKWLEIPEPSNPVDLLKYVKVDDVRQLVVGAITEVFEHRENTLNLKNPAFWSEIQRQKLFKTIDNTIETLVSEKTIPIVDNHINSIVEPEQFINSVVKRIKNKQLD